MEPLPVGWPVPADDDAVPSSGRASMSAGGQQMSLRPLGGRPGTSTTGHAVSVLADRLAAALVHHEPGWRLPRHSALAGRYNVRAAESDGAVEELVVRHLVRRLADGQLYRASPAEYIIGLEGVPGLVSHVDAMGGEFSCRSRQVAWRLPPEDISWALKVSAGQQVCVVRFMWTSRGEPAALRATYVPGDLAGQPDVGLPTMLGLLRLCDIAHEGLTGSPTPLHVGLQT